MSGTTPFDCPRCGAGLTNERAAGHRDRLLPRVPRRMAGPRRTRQDHRAHRDDAGAAAEPARAGPGGPGGRGRITQPQVPRPQQQPWGGADHGQGYGHGGKKRKSWLEEIFD